MLRATYIKHHLKFNQASGTSRGVLFTKPSWFIKIENSNGKNGIGECSIIPNLSIDDKPDLEAKLKEVCQNINTYAIDLHESLIEYPSIRFALEMALEGLKNDSPYLLFPSKFTSGEQPIIINGLIWMGDADEMLLRIEEKLNQGFSCLKLKIGAIDINQELGILQHIRNRFSSQVLELRVDANGAFMPNEALAKLDALSAFDIHSIEQPIKPGQIEEMYQLCRKTPFPIALDEELIGVNSIHEKDDLLSSIQPQFIILKPSLIGGWKASEEWIHLAEKNDISWWATSALEANVGLNAIAQWVYLQNNSLKQGLGTGQVFSNNLNSPLYLKGEQLYYNSMVNWENPFDWSSDE